MKLSAVFSDSVHGMYVNRMYIKYTYSDFRVCPYLSNFRIIWVMVDKCWYEMDDGG